MDRLAAMIEAAQTVEPRKRPHPRDRARMRSNDPQVDVDRILSDDPRVRLGMATAGIHGPSWLPGHAYGHRHTNMPWRLYESETDKIIERQRYRSLIAVANVDLETSSAYIGSVNNMSEAELSTLIESDRRASNHASSDNGIAHLMPPSEVLSVREALEVERATRAATPPVEQATERPPAKPIKRTKRATITVKDAAKQAKNQPTIPGTNIRIGE